MRDAFGVIRGFVFQVDLTVARWLELKANEVLELERGEDIDVAARAVHGDTASVRVLEQVKHRDRSITLRDPGAVEAIANFIEHLDHNPGLDLQFQFTTNAVAGTERPAVPPIKGSSIVAWEQIRTGVRVGQDADATVTAIRTLLAGRPKPTGYPESAWTRFRDVVTASDGTALRRVVQAFSWCVRVPPSAPQRKRIISQLVELGQASTESVAIQQYRRLFIHVLDCLSTPGTKRLSLEELRSILLPPQLSEEAQQSLDSLFNRIDAIEEQVDAIARQQDSDRLTLNGRIDELAIAQGVTAAVRHVVSTPTLRPSLPPARCCRRKKTIDVLIPLLDGHRWLELHGTVGFGKSELARLLAESAGGIRGWIDFRNLDIAEASMRLDAAAEMVAGPFASNKRFEAYVQFVARLGVGAVIVADDLPERSGGDPLSERLLELLAACQANEVRLISTTTVPSPLDLVDRIPNNMYGAYPVPPFGDADAAELFTAFDAPSSFLSAKRIQLINSAAGGHPTLLVAEARYREGLGWRLTGDTFLDLVGGKYANNLRRETVQKLIEKVADASTRDFLYRLNLAITSFSETEAAEIAAVTEPINRPVERLQTLLDVGIQRAPSGGLRVSPLFRLLGSDDVPADTRRGCHLVLGRMIMRRKTVGIDEAAAAVAHFVAGEDPNRAAIVLLRGLSSLADYRGRIDGDLLTMFWNHAPMPLNIDRGLRIAVRATQIRVLKKMRRPFDYSLHELENLIDDADDKDSWAVMMAGITLNIVLSREDVRRAHSYLLKAIEALPKLEATIGRRLSSLSTQPEELFWTTVSQVRNVADLNDWVSSIDALPPKRRTRLFRSDVADGGSMRLCDAVWLQEADKPEVERDWDAISASLVELGLAAERWGQPVLKGCAVRSHIVIQAEYRQDLCGAVRLAEAELARLTAHPKAMYPIRECIGRQYIYDRKAQEGLPWLIQSLADAGDAWSQERISTVMHIAANVADPSQALKWVEIAVRIAESDDATPQLMLARVKGELAFALWEAGERERLLRPLDDSLDHLMEARGKKEDELWRSAVAKWGHNAGYMVSNVTTGRTPDHAADGGEYTKPRLGNLMHHNQALAEWLPSARTSHLFGMVAILAEDLGDDETAARRALQALDQAREENNLLTLSNMGHRHAVSLVLTGHLSDAMDLAIASAAGMEALRRINDTGADVYNENRSVDEILGAKPSAEWSKAESFSLFVGVIPAALYLARTALDDPQAAAIKATEVVDAARIIAQTASDQLLWNDVADVFDQAFVTPRAGSEIITFGNELKARERIALQCVAYLGATLRPDGRPADSATAHVYIAGEARLLMPDRIVHRRLFVPFLQEYWQRVVARERFRFSPPDLTAELFERAITKPSDVRPQAMLNVILRGLGMRFPEKYRTWLQNAT